MKIEVLKISKDLLKRIDPSLRQKKTGKEDEDGGEYASEDQNQLLEVNETNLPEEDESVKAVMQTEQGGDAPFFPC